MSDFSGQLWCPRKWAHIAVMKCGEYQRELGCHVGCPAAASQEIIGVVREEFERAHLETKPETVPKYSKCQECGVDKAYNPSPKCKPCGVGRRGIEGKRRGGKKSAANFFAKGGSRGKGKKRRRQEFSQATENTATEADLD